MKKLLLYIFLCSGLCTSAQAQMVEWAQSFPVCYNKLAIAESGNNIIVLSEIIDSNSTFAYRLVSYDKNGNVGWSKDMVLGNNQHIDLHLEADSLNNIYLAGNGASGFVVDGFSFVSAHIYRSFVMKLNAAGTVQWLKSVPTIAGFSADKAGNIFFNGGVNSVIGSYTFDNIVLTVPATASGGTAYKIYVAKLNTNGNYEWIKQYGNTSNSNQPFKLKATNAGGVIQLHRSRPFGPNRVNEYFLTNFNTSGNIAWETGLEGLNPYSFFINTDAYQNVYIAGDLTTPMSMGQDSIGVTGRTSNFFYGKINASGNPEWLKKVLIKDVPNLDIPAPTTAPENQLNLTSLNVTNTGNIILTGSSTAQIAFLNQTITGHLGNRYGFVAELNDRREAIWNQSYKGNGFSFVAGGFIDSQQDIYLLGAYSQGVQVGPYALASSSMQNVWCWGGYVTKINGGDNSITGKVFVDANLNGVYDSLEFLVPDMIVAVNPGLLHTATAANGAYHAYVPIGNYTLTLPGLLHYNLNPASQSAGFTTTGQQASAKDFALIPAGDVTDIAVSAFCYTAARPGFSLAYALTLNNKGTISLSDSLTFTYDHNRIVFDSASVTPVYHQNGKLKWNYQLDPLQKQSIKVYFKVKASTHIRDTLTALASAAPYATDAFPADNQEEVKIVVTGSYDPNDKQVMQPIITPAGITAGAYLDYIIRFQNTGTDTAFTVIVTDSISKKLDLSSLQMVSASHDYTLSVTGKNVLNWRFNNILLPDSNTNEAASHGYIRFRIKANKNLRLDEKIENRAAIYFDFNEPVITNTAVTTVEQPWVETNQQITVYPNPTRYQATLQAQLNTTAEEEEVQVRMVNLVGQKVWSQKVKTGPYLKLTLNFDGMVKGMYLVQVIAGDEVLTTKLLIE